MEKTRNTFRIALITIALCGILLLAGKSTTFSQPRQQGFTNSVTTWLNQYDCGMVRITFVTAPADLQTISTLRLVKAGNSGIVLTYGNNRMVFFPYNNIISIEP
jgi:hypothetical protein